AGGVACWGGHGSCQLGIGDTSRTGAHLPARVPGIERRIVHLAAGHATVFAVDETGEVFAWGHSSSGTLGDRTMSGVPLNPAYLNNLCTPSPKSVSALRGARRIAVGLRSALAVDALGRIRAWGYNGFDTLGHEAGPTVDVRCPDNTS